MKLKHSDFVGSIEEQKFDLFAEREKRGIQLFSSVCDKTCCSFSSSGFTEFQQNWSEVSSF